MLGYVYDARSGATPPKGGSMRRGVQSQFEIRGASSRRGPVGRLLAIAVAVALFGALSASSASAATWRAGFTIVNMTHSKLVYAGFAGFGIDQWITPTPQAFGAIGPGETSPSFAWADTTDGVGTQGTAFYTATNGNGHGWSIAYRESAARPPFSGNA